MGIRSRIFVDGAPRSEKNRRPENPKEKEKKEREGGIAPLSICALDLRVSSVLCASTRLITSLIRYRGGQTLPTSTREKNFDRDSSRPRRSSASYFKTTLRLRRLGARKPPTRTAFVPARKLHRKQRLGSHFLLGRGSLLKHHALCEAGLAFAFALPAQLYR